MRFLLHVVDHVSHYVVFYTTLPYLFIHSSQLQFRNWDFFIGCRSLYRNICFKVWNSKIRYHTATLWAFYCIWWIMSLTTLSLTLTFSFTPLSSSFGIWFFSSHVVAYIVSFHSRFESRKSDIIRPRYEVFNACGGSCPLLPCLCTILPFPSLLSVRIRNLDFFIPYRSLSRKLWVKLLNSKIRYHTATRWGF